MTESLPRRAHLITGGFPPGSPAGHDHDYARLRLLELLAHNQVPASVGNDFADIARWLKLSRLLITYVAGPYPDAAQCCVLQDWLEAGGRWLGLHGTSGGRAERVEGMRQRRTVRTEHHALLGSCFLTHPAIRRIRVDVADGAHALTRGLPGSFEVEDEPYFIELRDPGATWILMTAAYGPDAQSPSIGTIYPVDTSLLADGATRAIAYTRRVGMGEVAYMALGHCASPMSHARPGADPAGTAGPIFRGAWGSEAFVTFLHNAIAWGVTGGAQTSDRSGSITRC